MKPLCQTAQNARKWYATVELERLGRHPGGDRKKSKGSEEPLGSLIADLSAGGYFFLLPDFLAAGFLALDFCGFDLADLLAIMLLVFWLLTSPAACLFARRGAQHGCWSGCCKP